MPQKKKVPSVPSSVVKRAELIKSLNKKIPGVSPKITPEQMKKVVNTYNSVFGEKYPGPKSKFTPSKEEVKKTIKKYKSL